MTQTTYILLILILLISVLFSVFNGFVINWKHSAEKIAEQLSVKWHGVGLVMHIVLVAILYLLGGWIWAIIGFLINWLGHNIIIAKMLNQKWYYIGKTAWTDKLIRKLLPFINFD